jgi:serine protease AprX
MKGVAPDARLVSIRVLDAHGNGRLSNVVKAFDWLLRRQKSLDVDVLNISWGTPQSTSYHKDLLSALVECAWFAGITVVVAVGNDGPTGPVATPAADPFVISVGSFDDQGTVDPVDDRESTFSSRGGTLDGFAKPDVLAPGRHVVSLRANGAGESATSGQRSGKSDRNGATGYIRMSGTSVSAGLVSGVAALVLSEHENYSPTRVKGALVAGTRAVVGGSAPSVDAAKAIDARGPANVGLRPSKLLLAVLAQAGVKYKGITWEGISWEGITWEGISWERIKWESVSWETVSWEAVSWESISWEGVAWEKVNTK